MQNQKIKLKIIFFAILFLGLFFHVPFSSATLLFEYGFEDWTGDADTTPAYPFYSASHWQEHLDSTEVVSSCGGKSAYEGTYFLHGQMMDTSTDPCLGFTHSTVNPFNQIGMDEANNGVEFSTDVISDTITIRYYFRTTGAWPNATDLGYMKFNRLYGVGGAGDSASVMININEEGDEFYIWNDGGSFWNYYDMPNGTKADGEWHAFCTVITRLNDTNTNPNVRVSVWWDDWDMTGESDATVDIWEEDFGDAFWYSGIGWQNWSATYPSELMGMDLDKIEAWDGLPDDASDTTPPSAPSGLSVS